MLVSTGEYLALALNCRSGRYPERVLWPSYCRPRGVLSPPTTHHDVGIMARWSTSDQPVLSAMLLFCIAVAWSSVNMLPSWRAE